MLGSNDESDADDALTDSSPRIGSGVKYTYRLTLANGILAQRKSKKLRFREVSPAIIQFQAWRVRNGQPRKPSIKK
jgi:hypothetical protein